MSFLFPAWWKLAAAGMVLVALVAGAWKCYTAGQNNIRAAWTAEKLIASENARLREQAAQKSNERIDRDYQAEKTRLAADKRVTDDSLRNLQTVIGSSHPASTTSGDHDPRDTVIDQCASALVALDGYAKGVASKATGLQSYTREVCLK